MTLGVALPKGERHPFFFLIDEFQDYCANEGSVQTLSRRSRSTSPLLTKPQSRSSSRFSSSCSRPCGA